MSHKGLQTPDLSTTTPHTTSHNTTKLGQRRPKLRQQSLQPRTTDATYFDWQGATPRSLEESRFTVAFQNVHGLSTKDQPLESKTNELLDNMIDFGIDVLGLSEHHIAMTNHRWRQRLHESFQYPSGQISIQFNSSPEPDSSGKLYGGTGIVAHGNVTGRILPSGKGGKSMGRWSYIQLRQPLLKDNRIDLG